MCHQLKKDEPHSALNGIVAFDPGYLKWVIAVDEDADPRDPNSFIWALCFRVQPDRDIRITPGMSAHLDPSAAPPDLPKKEFMEQAKKIWEEEGLPSLSPKIPWYGSSFGYWPGEYQEEAELALKGEHHKTGEKLARERRKL